MAGRVRPAPFGVYAPQPTHSVSSHDILPGDVDGSRRHRRPEDAYRDLDRRAVPRRRARASKILTRKFFTADGMEGLTPADAIASEGRPAHHPQADEVRLMQRRLREHRLRRRAQTASHAAGKLANPRRDSFILDDDFRHLRLSRRRRYRDHDATNPFGGRHLLPADRLRRAETALARADLIVTRISRSPAVEATVQGAMCPSSTLEPRTRSLYSPAPAPLEGHEEHVNRPLHVFRRFAAPAAFRRNFTRVQGF